MTTSPVANIWLEHNIPIQPISTVEERDHFPKLSVSSWYKKSSRIIAAGLSPDCTTAFITTEREVRLFNLDLDDLTASAPFIVEAKDIKDAAISDYILVILTETAILVYQYQQGQNGFSAVWLTNHPHAPATWSPICIAICDSRWGTRIAVGGRDIGPEVRLLHLQRRDGMVVIAPRQIYNMVAMEMIKTINFCPTGEAIVTVMAHSSRCLVWHIRQDGAGNIHPIQPIDILAPGNIPNGQGMSSASIFRSPTTQRKYVFCTVNRAPQSPQRSQLSPLAPSPASIPEARANQNNMTGGVNHQEDYAEPVIVGTVTSDGRYLGVVEAEGAIRLFRTAMHPNGGLTSQEVVLAGELRKLSRQTDASPTSVRFLDGVSQGMNYEFKIVAIDRRGLIVVGTYV